MSATSGSNKRMAIECHIAHPKRAGAEMSGNVRVVGAHHGRQPIVGDSKVDGEEWWWGGGRVADTHHVEIRGKETGTGRRSLGPEEGERRGDPVRSRARLTSYRAHTIFSSSTSRRPRARLPQRPLSDTGRRREDARRRMGRWRPCLGVRGSWGGIWCTSWQSRGRRWSCRIGMRIRSGF